MLEKKIPRHFQIFTDLLTLTNPWVNELIQMVVPLRELEFSHGILVTEYLYDILLSSYNMYILYWYDYEKERK